MSKQTFYFSHDGNARNDDKIIAVRMRHGAEGYGVYFMILERLLESTDYTSVKDYNIIAFDLRVGANIVKSIIEDFGLFQITDDGKNFYSEKFSNRMQPLEEFREKRRQAGLKSAESRAKKASIVKDSTKQQHMLNKTSTHVEHVLDKNSTEKGIVKESKVKSNTDVLPKSDIDIIENDDVPDFVKTERDKALLALEEQKKEIRGAAALENFDWQGWFFQSSQDKLFLEAPCMRHKISSGECVKYLQEFVYERQGIGDPPRSLSDLRKHFYAWIVKRVQGEKQNSINEKGKLTTALENVDGAVDRLAETIQKQINGGWYEDY